MFSKRQREAEILIDHRNSPGISEEFIRKNNLDAPAVRGGQTFESAVIVCHHCQRDVILNPNRSRERGWCWNCDHYICDLCEAARKAGAECRPFIARLESAYNSFMRGLPPKVP